MCWTRGPCSLLIKFCQIPCIYDAAIGRHIVRVRFKAKLQMLLPNVERALCHPAPDWLGPSWHHIRSILHLLQMVTVHNKCLCQARYGGVAVDLIAALPARPIMDVFFYTLQTSFKITIKYHNILFSFHVRNIIDDSSGTSYINVLNQIQCGRTPQ